MRRASLLLALAVLAGCTSTTAPQVGEVAAPPLLEIQGPPHRTQGPPTLTGASAYVDGDTLRIVARVDRQASELNRSWTIDAGAWSASPARPIWALAWLDEVDAAFVVWDYGAGDGSDGRGVAPARIEQRGRRLTISAPLVLGAPATVRVYTYELDADGVRVAFNFYIVDVAGAPVAAR